MCFTGKQTKKGKSNEDNNVHVKYTETENTKKNTKRNTYTEEHAHTCT